MANPYDSPLSNQSVPSAQAGSALSTPKSFSEPRGASYSSPFSTGAKMSPLDKMPGQQGFASYAKKQFTPAPGNAPEFNASNTNVKTGNSTLTPSLDPSLKLNTEMLDRDMAPGGVLRNIATASTQPQNFNYTPGAPAPQNNSTSNTPSVGSQQPTAQQTSIQAPGVAAYKNYNESNPYSIANQVSAMRGEPTAYDQAQSKTPDYNEFSKEFEGFYGPRQQQQQQSQIGQLNQPIQPSLDSFKDPDVYLKYLRDANPEAYEDFNSKFRADEWAKEQEANLRKQETAYRKSIASKLAQDMLWYNTPINGGYNG